MKRLDKFRNLVEVLEMDEFINETESLLKDIKIALALPVGDKRDKALMDTMLAHRFIAEGELY